MTADITYHSGPDRDGIVRVKVGKQDKLREIQLTRAQARALSAQVVALLGDWAMEERS
jgi:hypothetical protein